MSKTISFHTLGCKLNFAESSYLSRSFVEKGYNYASKGEEADVCVINTCSVTDSADRKGRQAIHKVVENNPNAFVIVTGCYAQINPNEIEKIEGVDLILGAKEKFDIASILQQIEGKKQYSKVQVMDIKQSTHFEPIASSNGRTRCFVKIQDGCNYFCTYCSIPFARGRSRCGTVAETIKTIEKAIFNGANEIILTGINIGDFGIGDETFFDLIKSIEKIETETRFRISSIEPNLLSSKMIEFIARSSRFTPHFHIPLQAGSDKVLELMKRKYTTELFAQKVLDIKNIMPDAFIGIDVIAGMRGETDELFQKGLEFLNSLNFSQLHIFPYSERSGTKALSITPIVDQKEKKTRCEILKKLSEQKHSEFVLSQKGKTKTVLWESTVRNGEMYGFTENYIQVSTKFDPKKVNQFERVVL